MRKLLPLLLLFTLACNFFFPPAPTPTRQPTEPAQPTRSPAPTETAEATLAPTLVPLPSPQPQPSPQSGLYLRPEDVTFHPEPFLYSGDVVSLEVVVEEVHNDPEWQEAVMSLFVDARTGKPLATTRFETFGIEERLQATFTWVWDTTGLEGPQTLVIAVSPTGAHGAEPTPEPLDVLTLTVNLLPADQRPLPEPLARWAQAESVCCIFHYLTYTAAARDIEHIKAEADVAFEQVEETLGVTRDDKVVFTLLSRLLGHGGFAAGEISLTYIDRNPAGLNLLNVFEHEGTHLLDRRIAGARPIIMTEGLAVYVAGGHYKPEDLDARMAALLALGRYIPLEELADNFYLSQHEIGYLEGGAFVKFLVDTYGWQRFKAFYGSFNSAPTDSAQLSAALQANFNKTLSEAEAGWLARLRSLPSDLAQAAERDLRLTVELYDTLRRYQQKNDASAYFLSAWLPSGPEARQRGIVADFVRHPAAPENIALETMLAAAQHTLETGDFDQTERLLASVNAVLDAGNLFLDPLAADYLEIVNDLSAEGYEAQTITLDGDTATITAIRAWPTLDTLTITQATTGSSQ